VKEGFSKEKFNGLVREIATLIKKRDSDIAPDDLRAEASQYDRFILNRFLAHSSDFGKALEEDAGQFKKLVSDFKKITHAIDSLSPENQFQISVGYLISEPLHPDTDGFERLRGLIYQAQEIIDHVQPAKKAKNRPKEDSKREFIEAVLLVFERATRLEISGLGKLPVMKSRRLKTSLYDLLECAQLGSGWFQSEDAAKKLMDRYIIDSRPFREDTLMSFNDFIQEN
jgi:hypothetical protein